MIYLVSNCWIQSIHYKISQKPGLSDRQIFWFRHDDQISTNLLNYFSARSVDWNQTCWYLKFWTNCVDVPTSLFISLADFICSNELILYWWTFAFFSFSGNDFFTNIIQSSLLKIKVIWFAQLSDRQAKLCNP